MKGEERWKKITKLTRKEEMMSTNKPQKKGERRREKRRRKMSDRGREELMEEG